MQQYLESSDYIDWNHPAVKIMAEKLKAGSQNDCEISQHCFEYVRDNIKHTGDYQLDQITCKASDVLLQGTGYCYAKSHLLAALLRANGIPAGLCYQRLSVDEKGAPYSLHGLNAVFLNDYGWYRIDSRGNKRGVNAQFTPPQEQLAFRINSALETNIEGIWASPMPNVVDTLTRFKTCREVCENLPDIALFNTVE